jgi:hypothetical protein
MFGTKMIGRSLVFGLGYLAGTRAGRERYDQLQVAGRAIAKQLRRQLEVSPALSPSSIADASRRAWDDSDIKLGRPWTAVLISIHVVARVLRAPLLRIDGDIVILEDDRLGHPATNGVPLRAREELTAGRLLALAEAELAAVDDRRRQRAARWLLNRRHRPIALPKGSVLRPARMLDLFGVYR